MVEITNKESPFSPGRPVPVDYFVARIKEIERLERAIKQTLTGRNENIFIIGEKGIGKSSLAGFIQYVAQKDYQFIGAHCSLGPARTLEEACRLIFQKLLQDLPDKSLFEKAKGIFGKYVKEIGLPGIARIEFTAEKKDMDTLRLNFLPLLQELYLTIKDEKKGIILILDDLNGISTVPEFALFLKSFVDQIALDSKPFPLLFILVGVEERREDLIKSHDSVKRIFEVIDLLPMSSEEAHEFFTTKTFYRQNISVSPEALSLVIRFSGGLPMLMHEVGDAVFWEDANNAIDRNDARNGIIRAAEIVGRKYLDPQVYRALRGETYRSTLRRVGKLPLGANFQRKEVLNKIPEKERKAFDNFLQRIKKLGIISETEIRGEYRFTNQLYHLYIWLEAYRAEKE